MKYVEDDSTIFWGIGNNTGVVARHAEEIGKAVEIIIPFEDDDMGEVAFSVYIYFLRIKSLL
jgi:NAD(P)H-hydrate repair Nnr-like enzyme with NAD(P)H-hydrate epimerase domain